MIIAACIPITAVAAGLVPQVASPQPVVLLDARLRAEPAFLVAINAARAGRSGEVSLIEDRGVTRSRGVAELAALVPSDWIPDAHSDAIWRPGASANDTSVEPLPWIALTDGQRYTGRLALASGTADPGDGDIRWEHDRLGTLAFTLDDVSRIVLVPGSAAADPGPAPAADTVLLLNGDRVEGFVERVGATLVISPPPAAAAPGGKPALARPPTTLDTAQVAEIRLANPSAPLRGMAAYLADGTVAALDSAATDPASGRLTIRARPHGAEPAASRVPDSRRQDSGAASVELSDLSALAFRAEGLTPLASVPIAEQHPDAGRRRGDPVRIVRTAPGQEPALGAADILLPGPMTAAWTLPPGSTRVAGWAQLDEGAWTWGDCGVVISFVPAGGGEKPLARGRVNASSPLLEIAVDVPVTKPGDRLSVRVEPGEDGPIQDRVLLRRMLVASDAGGTDDARPHPER